MPEGLPEASIVRLAPHVQLRFDAVRDAWTLLGPERVFSPSPSAVAVITACDGQASIRAVAEKLAAEFDAPAEVILKDALHVLEALRAKGYLRAFPSEVDTGSREENAVKQEDRAVSDLTPSDRKPL